MASRFLLNEAFWSDLLERIPEAKHVRAAAAYLGAGASDLFPLRENDELLVDMSLSSVRAGTTDPKEVQKYLNRGVKVFSRRNLHAKFFVIDNALVAGSANMSRHARDTLTEAAVLTTDVAAVSRARASFDSLCTEPVRNEYLEQCLKEYRPPRRPPDSATAKGKRAEQGKLWMIAGLNYLDLTEEETETLDQVASTFGEPQKAYERVEPYWLRYPSRPKFFERLRVGDWAIACTDEGRGYEVTAPSRVLGDRRYKDPKGKERFALVLECPAGAKGIRWTAFTRRLKQVAPKLVHAKPRTGPVVDDATADSVLRQWTPTGKFRTKAAL